MIKTSMNITEAAETIVAICKPENMAANKVFDLIDHVAETRGYDYNELASEVARIWKSF